MSDPEFITYNKKTFTPSELKIELDKRDVIVSISDVFKNYRTKFYAVMALRGIDLEIPRGGICCIRGPSGCGKTTLLNLVGAWDSITSGYILLNLAGRLFNLYSMSLEAKLQLAKQYIGYVHQNPQLIPFCTVAENLDLPLLVTNVGKEERKRRIDEFLKYLDLADKKNAFPSQLSGGQQQRVAVGSALIKEPPLLLADEPTSELDSENKVKLITLLAQARMKFKTTIIIATHDPDVAQMCDMQFILRDGQIVEKLKKI